MVKYLNCEMVFDGDLYLYFSKNENKKNNLQKTKNKEK